MGHEIKTLFLNSYGHEECEIIVRKEVINQLPDIVGFQVLASNRISTCKLIEFFHASSPSVKLLIGGIHASIMYRQLIDKYRYVIAVRGEGELTFAELVDKLFQKNLSLNEIDGIAFWNGIEVVVTKPRNLIENLDSLPWPKHEVFFNKNRTLGNLLTSRGCPFNCSFCCLDSISMRRIRYRSVKNVVDEIEYMINKFPRLNKIWIHDDTFFINNQRVIDLCDEIIRRQINIKFICSGRFKPLSAGVVEKLEAANFVHVCFGLESGNQAILNRAHKSITRQDAVDAFKLFAKSHISIFAFLIVGLPGETMETIVDTALFVQKLQKIKYVHYMEGIGVLAVYPGTEIYELTKEAGMINDNYWLKEKPVPFYTVEHTTEELINFKNVLLDYISCDKFFKFNPRAWCLQWRMAPYMLRDGRVRNDLILQTLIKLRIFYFFKWLIMKVRLLKSLKSPRALN